ncbi:MAG: SdpI family protein [Thermoanaerobaculia bacterium]
MSDLGMILGLGFASTGLLLTGLSVPLILKRVSMNPLYGIRIAKAYESESNWYAINSYGGRVLALVGAAVFLLGLCLFAWPPTSNLVAILVSFAPVLLVLLGVVPILRFARRL